MMTYQELTGRNLRSFRFPFGGDDLRLWCDGGAAKHNVLRSGGPWVYKGDQPGGLNGSMQHLLEAHARGFNQLRIVRERW